MFWLWPVNTLRPWQASANSGGKRLCPFQDNTPIFHGKANLDVVGVEWYGGQCSWENIQALNYKAQTLMADCFIAVGGGRSLDTIKAAAFARGVPLITIPTIAATCAAWTPLSAIYTDEGEYLEFSRKAALPSAVLVDTKVISQAPVRYLVSGLGDTLAKWYELAASTRGRRLPAPVRAALNLGSLCREIIAEEGPLAYQSVQAGQSTGSRASNRRHHRHRRRCQWSCW